MKDILKGVVVGVVGTLVMSGTAYAATGGNFLIGRSNAGSTQSTLSNSGSGAVLGLSTKAGQAPLVTGSNSGKAVNLNADRLDGLDGTQLQKRVSGRCDASNAVVGINDNGTVICAPVDNPVQEKAQFADKGIAISSITYEGSGCGDRARVRLTNNTNRTLDSVHFSLTYLDPNDGNKVRVAFTGYDDDSAPWAPGVTVNGSFNVCEDRPASLEGLTGVFRVQSLS